MAMHGANGRGERVFVGILIGGAAQKQFASWQRRHPVQAIRWMDRKKLHVTLFFLDHCSEQILALLSERTARVAQKVPAFLLSFQTRSRWFRAHPGAAAILHVRPTRREILSCLRTRLLREYRRAGIVIPRERRFVAHLTLGKSKQPISPDAFRALPLVRVPVSRLVVVMTKQGSHHDEYRIWKRIPLASKS